MRQTQPFRPAVSSLRGFRAPAPRRPDHPCRGRRPKPCIIAALRHEGLAGGCRTLSGRCDSEPSDRLNALGDAARWLRPPSREQAGVRRRPIRASGKSKRPPPGGLLFCAKLCRCLKMMLFNNYLNSIQKGRSLKFSGFQISEALSTASQMKINLLYNKRLERFVAEFPCLQGVYGIVNIDFWFLFRNHFRVSWYMRQPQITGCIFGGFADGTFSLI